MMFLGACSTDQVVDTTGSTVGFVAKTAVKRTIGAGKLGIRGALSVKSLE